MRRADKKVKDHESDEEPDEVQLDEDEVPKESEA